MGLFLSSVKNWNRQPRFDTQVDFNDNITRNLYGFYPLSYDTKNLARSSLANAVANNGAAVTRYAADRYAGFLDGVNDSFSIANNSLLNLGGTWSCWMKSDGSWGVDGNSGGTTVRGSAILMFRSSSTSSISGVHGQISPTTGTCSFQSKTASTTFIWNAGNSKYLLDNEWHHIALTFGTTTGSTAILYVDGVPGSPSVSTANIVTNNEPLTIGASSDPWWEEFKGHVSNVALWSRILTPQEILELAQNPWRLFRSESYQKIYSFTVKKPLIHSESAEWNNELFIAKSGTLPDFDNNELDSSLSAWRDFKEAINESVNAGKTLENPIASTYSLINTGSFFYWGGVLSSDKSIHLVPFLANRGQKINSDGIVSTYSLVYTVSNGAYAGGVLSSDGSIHFVPWQAERGQKINPNGIVSTYSLAYTAATNAYVGGVVAPDGSIHFIARNAQVGQKINPDGTASTYSLLYTTTDSYSGGVLAPNGDIHFVPHNANLGQKISSDGTVSTYSLVYTATNAYGGGVLAPDGSVHFVPVRADRGQKINPDGTVSTYSLVYHTTSGAYFGGILAPDGSIHFVPYSASVGQKINPDGTVSTYSLVYTVSNAYVGGILTTDGSVYFIPVSTGIGQKIQTNSALPFGIGICASPFLNKL